MIVSKKQFRSAKSFAVMPNDVNLLDSYGMFKDSLHWMIWADDPQAASCRCHVFGNKQRSSKVVRFHANPMSYGTFDMQCGEDLWKVTFSESELTKLIYTEPVMDNRFRRWFCAIHDYYLAKGSSEAIVESSSYTVMDSQKKTGGQSNRTLELRTKLDWSVPNALACDGFVTKVAKIYLEGSDSLPKHASPLLRRTDPRTRGERKVLERLENEKSRLPFLQ